jgi:hypothetical protein
MLVSLVFLLSSSIVGQESQSKQMKFMIGIEPGGTVLDGSDPQTGEEYYLYAIRLYPNAGLYLNKYWIVGVKGGRDWVIRTNYFFEPPLHELGGFVRFFPSWLEFPKRGIDGDEFRLYHELGIFRTDFYLDAEELDGVVNVAGLTETSLRFHSGINWRLFYGLTIDLGLGVDYFINRTARFAMRFGVEYHFQEQ